jgi:hypothetical protein
MASKGFDVPILFMAFNRPDTTGPVFEELRKLKPKKLFIAIDGPRNDLEKEKVDEVKKIVSNIDWPCKTKKLFRGKNLGCFNACVGAVSWFFENVEEGIILEDDCLADQSFFFFCKELLEKYRDDDRIMHISGVNFRDQSIQESSYYFSKYPYMWGWATWRRAWKKYNHDVSLYLKFKKENLLSEIFKSKFERLYMKHILESYYAKQSQGWDNPWVFSILINNGLSIVPSKNLVRNIGFSTNTSTHSRVADSFLSIQSKKINFPLKHPLFIIRDGKADERYVKWRLINQMKKRLRFK